MTAARAARPGGIHQVHIIHCIKNKTKNSCILLFPAIVSGKTILYYDTTQCVTHKQHGFGLCVD